MSRRPAILGGTPIFDTPLHVVKPALPELEDITPKFDAIFRSGILTNNAQFVRQFEELASAKLGVRHAIAMCNGTFTLILALKALKLKGKVVVPSFTFCATVHAVVWAGLEPVFADIDPHTFNISPKTIEAVLTDDVSAIMPVHVFGMPCDIEGIQRLAEKHGLKVLFDSAQAMGSRYGDKTLGSFGNIESFSAHATKIVAAGEGGLVTTNDDHLAEYLRSTRNFGVHGDVDCTEIGLNAKMCELSAVMAIEGLNTLDQSIAHRDILVDTYKANLADVPGITFQEETRNAKSNHQNLAILVDLQSFGLSRDVLFDGLKAENIIGRKYFYPPIHTTTAYEESFHTRNISLPVTERVSGTILCLPIYSDMPIAYVEKICSAIRDIHSHTAVQGIGEGLQYISYPNEADTSIAPLSLQLNGVIRSVKSSKEKRSA